MPILAYSADLPAPDRAGLLAELVDELDLIESRADAGSWEKASCYVDGHSRLRPFYNDLRGQQLTRAINKALAADAAARGKTIPGPSFLAHAKKVGDVFDDIFAASSKECPYDSYMQIAVCSLPREEKLRLRDWIEVDRPTRAELRRTIKSAVEERNGIYKPDFELKVSNFWKFATPHENGNYGGIHPGVMANLLYWFTEPGDVVLDAMAGTGLLADTLRQHRFYRESYEAEGSGPRLPLMSDIAPRRADILHADARESLPFDSGIAQLAIIDPPYLTIADDKQYANLGTNLDGWLLGLRQVMQTTLRCLKPGGLVAIITDDVLRKNGHQPIAYRITGMIAELGLTPRATIYNHNPNFVYTMGPAMMNAAKSARLQLNGCKVIQIASGAA